MLLFWARAVDTSPDHTRVQLSAAPRKCRHLGKLLWQPIHCHKRETDSHRDLLQEKYPVSGTLISISETFSVSISVPTLSPYARNFLIGSFLLHFWFHSGGFLRSLVCPLHQGVCRVWAPHTQSSLLSSLTCPPPPCKNSWFIHILNTVCFVLVSPSQGRCEKNLTSGKA